MEPQIGSRCTVAVHTQTIQKYRHVHTHKHTYPPADAWPYKRVDYILCTLDLGAGRYLSRMIVRTLKQSRVVLSCVV